MENKHCKRCDCTQPVANFGKDKSTKDGFTTCCKTCRNQMSKSWRTKNPEKARQSTLNWVNSHKEAYLERARAASAERRSALPSGEDAKLQREWRSRNPDKARQHYLNHLTKYGKSYRLSQNREHRTLNSEKYALVDANKRANRLKRSVKWANKEAIQRFYNQARGLTLLTNEKYHVDHVIPLQGKAVCGLHNEFNLQVIPAAENLTKGSKFNVED